MTFVTGEDPFHRFFVVGNRRNALVKRFAALAKIVSRDHQDLFPLGR
jgi:hypothetical protein